MDRKKKLDEEDLAQVNGGADSGEYNADGTGGDVSEKGPAGAKKKSIKQYGSEDFIISDNLFK